MYHTRLLALSGLFSLAVCLQLPIDGRKRASTLSKRDDDDGVKLINSEDISYYADLVLGGDTFSCLIDTGSSDLWVAGTVSHSKTTGATSGVNYAVGNVTGPIMTADLVFSGYEVPDQAFIQVTPDSSNKAGSGLIGLGPNSGSNVYDTLDSDVGYSVVTRIFLQNTTTPNIVTISLGRLEDPTNTFPGNITVGEILDGYDDVQNQPRLSVTTVSLSEAGNQHFQLLLDQNGLIGPDGEPIPIKTEVDKTSNDYQATAVVDSGFSLTQLPKAAADAIYSRFDGAEYVYIGNVGNTWIVPCELEVNITFKFSGQSYPIHPLDATLEPSVVGISSLKNSKGQSCCFGLFQPMSFDTGPNPTYDIILGMSFIRNAYTLLNYGDFIGENTTTRGDPYIQFLSTTDPAGAHSDFVQVRLNGVDTTGDQTLSASHKSSKSSFNKPLVFGICAVLLLLGIILMVYACYIRKRNAKSHSRGPVYRPLASPTPPMNMSIRHDESNLPPPKYSLSAQHLTAPGSARPQLYDPSHRESYASYSSQDRLYDPQQFVSDPQPYDPQPYPSQTSLHHYHSPWDREPHN